MDFSHSSQISRQHYTKTLNLYPEGEKEADRETHGAAIWMQTPKKLARLHLATVGEISLFIYCGRHKEIRTNQICLELDITWLDIHQIMKRELIERYLSSHPGRTGGRGGGGQNRFWDQLNNSKTVSDMGGLQNELIPITTHPERTPNRVVVNRRPQIEHIMWVRPAV